MPPCCLLVCLACGVSAASAASPAPSGPPTAGGELAIDPPVYGLSSSWESGAAIATGGGGYLAAWLDGRGSGDRLYASRLAGDGRTVLDPTGIQLTDTAGAAPAISFDGTNYLVVWAERGDVLGLRVAETGLVVDASPFRIGDAPWAAPVATTFDGQRTIVVWEGDGLLRRAWVGRDGTVETETTRAFQTGQPAQSAPALAYGNAETILAWCERDASGTTGDVLRVALVRDTLPDPGSAAALATDPPAMRCPASVTVLDGGFLAAWREAPLDRSAPSIVAMPIGADGAPAVSAPWGLASGVQIISSPSVAIDGGQLLVCWQEATAENPTIVAGRRLTPAGELLDAATETLSAPQWGLPDAPVATAALPGTPGWVVIEPPYPAVTAFRIDPTAPGSIPTNGTAVSTAANDERSAAASFGGGVYLVVWTDSRSQDGGDIYGTRVSADGEVLDRSAIPIAVAPDAQSEPTVAFDGADFLVVWTDDRNGVSLGTDTHGDVYAARVSPAGVVRDAKGIAIVNADGNQGRPTVACRAGACVVAWVDDVTRAIDVATLRPGVGSTAPPSISAPTEIRGGPYLHDMPAIASSGADFLLAWTYNTASVDAIRLDANGRVVDQQPIVVSDLATNPAVAATGDGYLVVWEDRRDA